MLEKIIRAVKSNNKKRGRNITIEAVIIMLLSCTAVMGKDVIGLEIKNDGGIKFIGKDGVFTPGDKSDPYFDNKWDGNTYTNNSTIFGKATESSSTGYGLKLSGNLENMNFINNGLISGEKISNGYGIYNTGGIIGSIENNGSIFGKGYANNYGIYNENSSIGSLLNSGGYIWLLWNL